MPMKEVRSEGSARRARGGGAFLAAALTALACGCCARRPPAPAYSVTVDLTASIRDLGSDDLFVSEPAAELLVALGAAALGPLDLALRNEPHAVRLGVVDVVKQIGGTASVPPLLRAAADADAEVRANAILALGSIGDRRAARTVEEALEDGSVEVRRAAAAACASLCASPEAIRRLVAVALSERSVFGMSPARESLRRMLAGADRARASEAERAIGDAAPPALAAADADQRGRAALLLADAGDRRAVPFLVYAAEHAADPLLRVQAIVMLQAVGNASTVAALARIVRRDDMQLRSLACQTLGSLAARGVGEAERESRACARAVDGSKRPR
jgi:HEAT repeat protein